MLKKLNTSIFKFARRLMAADPGATLVEYALMAVLIAGIMVAVVEALGKLTQNLLTVGNAF